MLFYYYFYSMKKLFVSFILLSGFILAWCSTSPQKVADPVVTPPVVAPTQDVQTRVIDVEARRFEFTPSTITVQQGEKVALRVNNIDTTHNAYFASMDTTTDEAGNIVLDTSTPGTYEFACATMCGGGHREMKWVVIVQ